MREIQQLLLLLVALSVGPARGQEVLGEYPSLSAQLSTFRPVESTSVCGEDGSEDYCLYTTDSTASLPPKCMRLQCDDTCPFNSTSPLPLDLASLAGSFGMGISATQGRPGTTSAALQFQDSSISVLAAIVPAISVNGFSFAAWINQDEGNEGALIAKAGGTDGSIVNYAVTISSSAITFTYLPDTTGLGVSTFTLGNLDLNHNYWHHIAVTVFQEDAAIYINGSLAGVESLLGQIVDDMSRDIKLGQIATSDSSYNGLMQDIYYYSQALTAREVVEIVTGSLPFLHLSTRCHCPPSHPLANPQNEGNCIQHQEGDLTPRGSVGRLNSQSHPVGHINDLSSVFEWISSPGIRNINVTVNLTTSLYELFLIRIQFSTPRPKAVVLETSRDGGLTFAPVQYYADDCMFYFGLEDNGPILAADDTNCLTSISTELPTSGGAIRFRLFDQATRNFDMNTSPELRAFIQATHLRLRLVDFFVFNNSLEHQYYAIQEITVVARCACNGHSSSCGMELDSVCDCVHNTEGDTCDVCLPTHQDKPWRYGTSTDGFPCKPCQCNGHASTCVYDASVDPFPESYEVGGGGVCQDCQDDTAGVNCETCIFGYFRPSDRLPSDPSPCVACMCNPNGISDEGDCVKDQGSGGQIIGQCFCKPNIIGLKCDTCRPGFSNLAADNPDGCDPCNCNTAGTFNGMDTCDSETGQCLCKANVVGLTCDTCRNGTTSLDADNFLGCEECSCDAIGSASTTDCDPVMGTCVCLPGVTGERCDQCQPGFTGFSSSGCVRCSCHQDGATSDMCDPITGQCPCLPNVLGLSCDSCSPGFHNISASCVSCDCDPDGTVNGDMSCDQDTAQCPCKPNVQGTTCDTCMSGFTSLLGSDPNGCSVCDCFSPNTDQSGAICDPLTSQCDCVSSATGLRCESCLDGFYLTDDGCVSCDCNPMGASGSICNKTTGDCDCQSAGVTGRTCEACLPGFFTFPSCVSCGCNIAGAVEGSVCNQNTGVCSCKEFVTGTSCDQCLAGFQNLEASNPSGCSAPPDELAPPTLTPASTSILLVWLPPEVSNGFIQTYNVYQDGFLVASVPGLNYTRQNLQPDTPYSFFIEAINSAGSTRSADTTGRTLEGIPEGVAPPTLVAISSDAIQATWTTPNVSNGQIVRYELVLVVRDSTDEIFSEIVLFSGLFSTETPSGLMPATEYEFLVRACTMSGCGSSETARVLTQQAPPTFQMQPNVSTLTSASLLVEWEEPSEPNGIVFQYVVRQREAPFQGEGVSIGTVDATVLSFSATGLRPFTVYEFSVVSFTDGGGTQSEWSEGITAEAAPDSVQPPSLLALSSSEIQVSWSSPLTPNGVIAQYSVFQVDADGNGEVLVATSSQPDVAMVTGLLPFLEYFFVLEACTSQGCTRSTSGSVFTQEGVPMGQPPPVINMTTPSSISLLWDAPSTPNGLISSFSVLRRIPSLSPSPLRRDIGVAFDGNVVRRFSPDDNTLGGITNTISLSFRTFAEQATLIYYLNTAATDLIALELRGGVPWFSFDAGSGPAVVQPDLGGADMTFNDGAWHSVTATQTTRTGTILVDGMYMGTGLSGGSDQVISSRQVLYVGGVPDGAPLGSLLGTPDSALEGRSYAGCLFGVTLNDQPLDFSASTPQGDSNIQDIPGCPIQLEAGLAYLGGGYLSLPQGTISTTSFSWTFDLRTTHNQGLVFFAHDADQSGVGVELREGLLHLVLLSGNSTQKLAISDNMTCDGEWHTVLIDQSRDEISVFLDGIGGSLFLPMDGIVFSSGVFFGGVPMASVAYDVAMATGLNVYAPFSGCTRPHASGLVVEGVAVPMPTPTSHMLVRFDGCHASSSVPLATTCEDPWLSLPSGTAMEFTDEDLEPWTEYLYGVEAHNTAGSATSGWTPAITEEAAPSGVGVVSLVSRTSSSLTTSWTTPTSPNGLITRYEIAFNPVRTVGLDSPVGTSVGVSLEVTMPEMVFLAVANGLHPATEYSTTLAAFTSGGAGSGMPILLTTAEAVPGDVRPPMVVGVGSRELTITWAMPTTPNGIITLYTLYISGMGVVFSGTGNTTVVTGLLPFSEYTLVLEACTSAGCANSTAAISQTLPDAPTGLAPPTLTVLSPSSIMARWQLPSNPNGVLTRLELRRLLGIEAEGEELFEVVFDDVNFDLETTITGLAPNTLYMFQLAAFNTGGSVTSPTAQVLTLEDIPDDIDPPRVDEIGPTHLLVSWSPPGVPNGDIILYNLTLDGGVVFSTSDDDDDESLSYNITELRPFTSYSLAIIACTVRGCGSSNQSAAITLEDTPTGYAPPTIIAITPTAISVDINPVDMENGVVTYTLFLSGDFVSVSTEDVEFQQRTIFNGPAAGAVQYQGLIPFTNYSLYLVVSNNAGSLLGPTFSIETLPAVAEGFFSPSLSLLTATSLLVEWDPPLFPNGPLLSYEVTRMAAGEAPITSSHGLVTMATLSDLAPFTVYEVVVSVTNTEGVTVSPEANITTGETAPAGFDRIVLLEGGPRHLVIAWDPPAQANGILISYTVFLGDEEVADTPPTVLDYNVTELLPFTSYNFTVMVCTSEGCVESPALVATTLEDVPEGISAPFVSAGVGQPVLIAWTPPTSPNGVLLLYRVERRGPGDSLVTIGTLPASASSLIVGDQMTTPFTEYEYRVVAENSVGSVASSFSPFLTLEAAPDGVLPPLLTVVSSSIIQVSFQPPLLPQGNISSYTITRSTPTPRSFTFTPDILPSLLTLDGMAFLFNDTGLLPFTNHTYLLTVCTGGGCTDSDTASALTLEDTPTGLAIPTTNTINSSAIMLEWVEPSMPNGVIVVYDVFSIFFGFDNSSRDTVNCCEVYADDNTIPDVCSLVTTTTETDHLNTNLDPYSYYSYCVVATNNVGSGFSSLSPLAQTTPAPMPLIGPTLNATTINSTAVFLEWSPLEISDLLGPLDGYTVYQNIEGTPGLGGVISRQTDLFFTVTGLLASTDYVFVVEVSNGVGTALSNNASATTEEGIPVGLPAPEVTAVRSDTLSVLIFEPEMPNGDIILYNIILDSQFLLSVGVADTVLLGDLVPFTLYIVQLEACTQFGCTRSPLVPATTLESAPVDLGSPFVMVTGPNSVDITWNAPNQPNGNITQYQLIQSQDLEDPPTLIFVGLAFEFSTSDLRPFTSYSFQVIAENGAGNVTSIPTTVTTQQAPPSSFAPPYVVVVSAMEIVVSWSPPEELNGNLLGYQVYRDGVPVLSELTAMLELVESDLVPFTSYEYFVEVCTSGGCLNSSAVSNVTFESLPEGVSNLTVSTIGPRSLVLTWEIPAFPNGDVTVYTVILLDGLGVVVFDGLGFNTTVSDLQPFTDYTFGLMACNGAGCAGSDTTQVQTLQTDPEGLDVPILRNLSSSSVAVRWSAPAMPNGVINTYILRRGDNSAPEVTEVIFQGLGTEFNDVDLGADTLYFYTVEAVNEGGSIISSPSFFRTVPDLAEGLLPPTLDVQGATAISVNWSAPSSPNGVISSYMLYRNGDLVLTGLQFSFQDMELDPFTTYSYFVEACNQAGCASSIAESAQTQQALVSGVAPPLVTVLGPTSAMVSWSAPTQANGIVTQYQIRRRFQGMPITETLQHVDIVPTVFTNFDLIPFTDYEYRLRVTNGAGSVFSELLSVRTSEDVPGGVSTPIFGVDGIASRNVTATWTPPTNPNGILLRYLLEFRLSVDPVTLGPGTFMTAQEVPPDVTIAMATGLSPVMEYDFRVVAVNSAGGGAGDFVTVLTSEDVPEGVQPIVVEQRTGSTLVLTWTPPIMSNGIVREYQVLLDEETVYRDSLLTHTISGLQPFTGYSLQLAACTGVGCTFGTIQSATTAEVAPVGQAMPSLVIVVETGDVAVRWIAPVQPNGIITRYDVLRRTSSGGVATTVFTTGNALVLEYVDIDVLPAQEYQYAITSANSAGTTDSDYATITTPEAAPEGLTAPALTVGGATTILVSWLPPSQPNGVVVSYSALRTGGGVTNMSVFSDAEARGFSDENLLPFTSYSYVIQACTSAACSLSPPSIITTDEATPTDLPPPTLRALSSTSISIMWVEPRSPNGVITRFVIEIAPGGVSVVVQDPMETELNRNISSNLMPFTAYNVTLEACNSVGCVAAVATIRTLESTPQFILPPQANVVNSTALAVTWQPPFMPNGVIVRYDLRRNDTLVFNGSDTMFVDAQLMPNQHYSYTLRAYTSIGPGEESAVSPSVATPRDTPQDVSAPSLLATSANSISVSWVEPATPNGLIQRYVLLVDERVEFDGLDFQTEIVSLNPFTSYRFQLMACTTTCGSSPNATAITLEAPPTGLAPPVLTELDGSSVRVTWSPPSTPNGVITLYKVLRRQVLPDSSPEEEEFVGVFNGSGLSYTDSDESALFPATRYEYRISALNSAGTVTSDATSILLPDAPPEGVTLPVMLEVTPTSITLQATPPETPNGVITEYRLVQDGEGVSSIFPPNTVFVATDLSFFTEYEFSIEACTSAGCTAGGTITVLTGEALPTGLSPPVGVAQSARVVEVSWTPPTQPNGIILSYSLWYRRSCPQRSQTLTFPDCTLGTLLTIAEDIPASRLTYTLEGTADDDPLPYTSYEFILEATNGAGSVNSTFSEPDTDTPPSAPEAVGTIVLDQDFANGVITLEWGNTFRLNDDLSFYELRRNGILIIRGTAMTVSLPQEPASSDLVYTITVTTVSGASVSATISTTTEGFPTPSPPPTIPTTNATTSPTVAAIPFYEEPAFIIGVVIFAFVMIFLITFCFCCIYKCTCSRPHDKKSSSGLQLSRSFQLDTPSRKQFSRLQEYELTPLPHHTMRSWSPGDPYQKGEVPDTDNPSEIFPITSPTRSYSPSKVERSTLADNRLSDIVISNPSVVTSPKQLVSAKDDFGSFKHQQTTFEDTKV